MMRIGIVGHRFFSRPDAAAFVTQQCLTILRQAQAAYADVTALSAIAEGADSLFAEAALSLNIPLEIVLPFEEYAADFTGTMATACYARLRRAACKETQLAYISRSEEAYVAAMHWVVAHSDVLIAAWDGGPGRGRGGTADAVRQAVLSGRDWIHLNVDDLSTTFHVRQPSRYVFER
ncbi:MAG TPA: hypothetical protein VFZ66_12270 [Herpetosiphonaceae bacterium]